jgi:hypothetical protein
VSEWYVFVEGGEHVGPVTAELIARGIAAGKVPRDARVARGAPVGWRDVMDVPDVVDALDALDEAAKTDHYKPVTDDDLVLEAPDPTDVFTRQELPKKERAPARPKEARPSTGPARAPLAPRVAPSSKPPMPAQPVAPSSSAVGAAPRALPNLTPSSQAPNVPPAPSTMPVLSAPSTNGAHGHAPISLTPAPAPAPALAPAPAPAPPPAPERAEAKPNDEPKPPAVDPRLRILVPMLSFGVCLLVAIAITVYAFVTKSYAR